MVLISAAVEQEVSSLIQRLDRPLTSTIGGRKLISGQLWNKAVGILVTGPGIVNTASALTAVIENLHPGQIIQTGCAGVFRQTGLNIGDIAVATEEIDAQIGIESPFNDDLPQTLPFPLLQNGTQTIKGRYPLNVDVAQEAFERLKTEFISAGVKVIQGPFVTVSTVTATDRTAEKLYSRFKACMESMEGSAAAHVAVHYGIPLLEIRAASNFVGRRNRQDWNLDLAFKRCAAAVYLALK